MLRPRSWLVAVCLLWSAPAHADVAPLPSRPVDWNVPEPPVPDPPPEKPPLVPVLIGCATLLIAIGAARRIFDHPSDRPGEAQRCLPTA